MVFISELQKDTVFLLDDLINENKTHEEIVKILLYKFNYEFIKEIKNGYMSKTQTKLYKNNENSFVILIKRRNGYADWETIRLS